MIFFTLANALAYTCYNQTIPPGCPVSDCEPYYGNTYSYRHLTNLPVPNETAVEVGLDVWEGGQNKLVRGANFTVVKEAPGVAVPHPTWQSYGFALWGNYENDIYVMPVNDPFWTYAGLSPYVYAGMTVTKRFGSGHPIRPCETREGDIIMSPERDWLPTPHYTHDPNSDETSISPMIAHEMGHIMGLGHSDEPWASTMNAEPHGDAVGNAGVYRLYEEEAVYLRAFKPGSSTGNNVFLSSYEAIGSIPGNAGAAALSNDHWGFGSSATEFYCPGESIDGSRHSDLNFDGRVTAMTVGTLPTVPVKITWGLRPAGYGSCKWSSTNVISTRYETLAFNTPALYRPTTLEIPITTPPGTYQLCAAIDSNPVSNSMNFNESDDWFDHHDWVIEVLDAKNPVCN